MEIVGHKESSLSEWDGRVSSIVWVAGCNWRCPYCHNHRMIVDHESLERIDEEVIFNYIESNVGWIDGICISGGEPTLQPDLIDFIGKSKGFDIGVKLETNGSSPEVIEQLISDNMIDNLALDVKQIPGKKLSNITGSDDIYKILQSFNISFRSNIEVEYHTTLCPSLVNSDDIKEIGKFLHGKGKWILQQYDPTDVLDQDRAGKYKYNNEELEEILEIAKKHHNNVILKNA